MSITARLVALAVLAALAIAGWWRLTAYYDNQGYQRARAEAAIAMLAQQERNRELQRAAEKHYVVQSEVREEYIIETVKEIRYVTQNLAACQLAPAAVSMLNDAARCAREDRPAACGAGRPMQNAKPAP